MLRFGIVSDIKKDSVSVIVPGKDNNVSEFIPLLANMALLPKVGQPVACIFEGEGLEKGVCLGLYYNESLTPEDKVIVDRDIQINGDTQIDGDTKIDGGAEINKSASVKEDLNVSNNIHYGGSISGGA